MAREVNMEQILALFTQPAFWVADGAICQQNAAAAGLLLCKGDQVAPMLATGREEYAELERGNLYLALQIGGQSFSASVQRMEDGDLFLLEDSLSPELRAMSLASLKMREPVAALMAELDRLIPELSDAAQAGRINRRLHQMLRILGNMSAGDGMEGFHPELQDMSSLLDELFEKAADLAESRSLELQWTVPNERIYTLVDWDKLERAVYNMLSNAIKASRPGGQLFAKLTQKHKRLHISVSDNGQGIRQEAFGSLHKSYLRPAGWESPDRGIGLGMGLIASAVRMHGGTVLLESPPEGGTRITMTIPIRQKSGELRSSIVRMDYTGGRDHALVELSDVLPSSVYER